MLAGAVVWLANDERAVRTSLSVAAAMDADTTGYARAVEPRPFRFPADHGPHPDYRTEWWYYTGNLSAASGRRFGYQLTLFRTALRPPGPASGDSTWSTRQLYMGHFAVSDPDGDAFYAFERFSRGAAGLAGASASPYRVWLEDWRISGETADAVRLTAREEDLSIDLSLQRMKPIMLQGEDGLDRKGPEPGNASYYYSMSRMATTGRLTVRDELFEVEGLSWLDREWSTGALGEKQVGWDWFSLQLDDGRDVMFYRLRQTEGTTSSYSSGVVVEVNGAVERLHASDVELQPARYWDSPASGRRYPVEWSFRVPALDIDLDLIPYLDHQELNHAVTYWEGAVRVEGSHEGSGFVELTGYGDAPASPGGV